MRKAPLDKIPTTYFPEGWAETAAEKFTCAKNTVERVVYGKAPSTEANKKIWDHMLTVAEKGKAEYQAEMESNRLRLQALTA